MLNKCLTLHRRGKFHGGLIGHWDNIVFRGTEARLIDPNPKTVGDHARCSWDAISEVKSGARPLENRNENMLCQELFQLKQQMQLWTYEYVFKYLQRSGIAMLTLTTKSSVFGISRDSD